MTTRIIPIDLDVPGHNGVHRRARIEFFPTSAGVELILWRGTPAETRTSVPFARVMLTPHAFAALGAEVANPDIPWSAADRREVTPDDTIAVSVGFLQAMRQTGTDTLKKWLAGPHLSERRRLCMEQVLVERGEVRRRKGAHVEPRKGGGWLVVTTYEDAGVETLTFPTQGEAEDRAKDINGQVAGGHP